MTKKDNHNTENEMQEGTVSAPTIRKGIGRVWTVVIACLLVLAVGAGSFCAGWFGYRATIDERMRSLIWAIDQTDRNYYQEIDLDALYDDMFDALGGSLDKYSTYYSPEESKKLEQQHSGNNVGLGINLAQVQDGVQFSSVMENSPACIAGLKRGDYIVGYAGTDGAMVAASNVNQIVQYIDGQTGAITLYCADDAGGTNTRAITLERKAFIAAYVVYADSETGYVFRGERTLTLVQTQEKISQLDDKTAYIRLDSFNGNVAGQLRSCLTLMRLRGRDNLIVDLRGNGGGYLDKLNEVSSCLLKTEIARPLVSVARYRDGSEERFYATGNSYGEYFTSSSKITVLADVMTASASEALIGAMIDYGTIGYSDVVLHDWSGAHTYGKGIMQTHYKNYFTGETMKLTSATVHWPVSGRCIHDVGITPADGARSISLPRYATAEFFTQLQSV